MDGDDDKVREVLQSQKCIRQRRVWCRTTPSDDDDDERLNLSASLRGANPRPLIQLANLAPQLRKPNTTLVKASKPRLSTDLARG